MGEDLYIQRSIPLHVSSAIPRSAAQISLCLQIEKLRKRREFERRFGNQRLVRKFDYRIDQMMKFLSDG